VSAGTAAHCDVVLAYLPDIRSTITCRPQNAGEQETDCETGVVRVISISLVGVEHGGGGGVKPT
jgi:hypothetical protein